MLMVSKKKINLTKDYAMMTKCDYFNLIRLGQSVLESVREISKFSQHIPRQQIQQLIEQECRQEYQLYLH